MSLDNLPSGDEMPNVAETSGDGTRPPLVTSEFNLVSPSNTDLADLQNRASLQNLAAGESLVDEANGSVYHPLDPRHIQVERFGALIISLVLGLPTIIGSVVVGVSMGFTILWIGATGIVLALLSLLIAFLFAWPPISHRHVRWKLDEVGLEIQHGVYWRKTLSVPLARLQHADLTQGPVQRQWGLAKLTVYTAGTENASVELDGLAYETAVELRDRLLRQQGVSDVV